jgi:hypothetical protein
MLCAITKRKLMYLAEERTRGLLRIILTQKYLRIKNGNGADLQIPDVTVF